MASWEEASASGGEPPTRDALELLNMRSATPIQHATQETFEVRALLGQGSFGTVYEVAEKRTGRSLAMKVLLKESIFEHDGGVRYAMTEKNIQADMDHPFVVTLVSAFQTTHELVLVMPHCRGGTLKNLVATQPEGEGGIRLPEEIARVYLTEVLLAVEYIHSKDIVYRDMKSENVMLDEEGHAMLTDFGLSKRNMHDEKQSSSFVGSIAFMAPEVLAEEGHAKAVDVYGLGVLLFEMLTAFPPYFSEDKKTVRDNIMNADLEVPAFASAECASILRDLLARNPEQRLGGSIAADVRGHPFLASVDFDAVLRREGAVLPPPLEQRTGPAPPDPFKDGHNLLSLVGASTVPGWEFPVPDPAFVAKQAEIAQENRTSKAKGTAIGAAVGAALIGGPVGLVVGAISGRRKAAQRISKREAASDAAA